MHALWVSALVLSNTSTSLSCCSLTNALINFDIHGEDVSVGQSKEESGGSLLGGSLFGVYS